MVLSFRISSALLSLTLLFAASTVAQVSVPIVNASFEEPDVANGTAVPNTSFPGWTFTAVGGFLDDGIEGPSSSFHNFLNPVPDGHQVLYIQEATLHQTLAVAAQAGTCTLSFFVYVDSIAESTNSVRLFAGDVLLAEIVPTADDMWLQLAQVITIAPGSPAIGQPLRIEIDQWSGPNKFTWYDRIELICDFDPNGPCQPGFPTTVIDFSTGVGAEPGNVAANALGNDPTTQFDAGAGGHITLGYADTFSTSGDSQPDFCIDELGVPDCYRLQLEPANLFTASALAAAGWTAVGAFMDPGPVYCGDQSIDLDALAPGFVEGDLRFVSLRIQDDDSVMPSGDADGYELLTAEAKYVCPPQCLPSFVTEVIGSMQGPGAVAAQVASGALGNDTSTRFSSGVGGSITVAFGGQVSTSGDSGIDLCVDEYDMVDCYSLLLSAANVETAQAMAAAGFALVDGFYDLGVTYCSDQNIDLDALIPGFANAQLRFDSIRMLDDGSAGNGYELVRMEAKFVCPTPLLAIAKIGDRVFRDDDCDGVQDAGEVGIAGVPVRLLDFPSLTEIMATTTDSDGRYLFCVLSGMYVVEVGVNTVAYAVTIQNAPGAAADVDSDIDPVTNRSGVITILGGEVNLDVDAGLCVICVGQTASIVSAPCGFSAILDPVLTATPPIVGDPFTLTLDSVFPNSQGWIFASIGPVTPVVYAGCSFYVDVLNPANIALIIFQPTDANGDLSITFPVPIPAFMIGLEVIFQGRVCAPEVSMGGPPGPFAPIPDFFSNGLTVTLGCP